MNAATDTAVPRTGLGRRLGEVFGPFVGLAFVIAIGCLSPEVREAFLTVYNFKSVATQTVIVGLGAIGMTLVIVSGGIDLSVGSVIALSSVVTAACLKAGLPPVLALGAGVLTGGVTGSVNGFFVTRLKLVPFIVTLGMLGIARGVAKWIAREQKIDAPPSWLMDLMNKDPGAAWLGISPGIWLMILLATLVALVLARTPFGTYVFAIGSNEAAARVCGIRVEWIKLSVYIVAGLLTGLAGVMQFARLTVGDPTVATGAELDVIAAVVIGGGSLSGGEGSVLGSLVGAFIMAFLRNECVMFGWPNYIQEIIIGVIIVVAVALDRLRHR